MDQEQLRQFQERLEQLSRDYGRTLGAKADELERVMGSWQSGELEAKSLLVDRVHRLASAGSFGFADISDAASHIEQQLVAGARFEEVDSQLSELIALVRSRCST